MAKNHCEYCNDGYDMVAFVLAEDSNCEIHFADYCPFCGRCLT